MSHKSIASFTEILVALGISDLTQLSVQNEALARLCHGPAEGAVKDYLGYNPILDERTEYYPTRSEVAGNFLHCDAWSYYATVSPLRNSTRAEIHNYCPSGMEAEKILLRSIPARSITALYEDTEGRSGQGTAKFPASSLLTLDDDYWLDFDESGHCRSGVLFRKSGAWTGGVRSVKVVYYGGYSPDEFMGFGDIDGSPIKQAVILTAVAMFKQLRVHQGSPSGGFAASPTVSETLSDYKYVLGTDAASNLGSFGFDPGFPPDSAKLLLEPFIHYGRKVTI